MRTIALVALLCTFSEVTLAQTPECKSIPKASDRLACYDKAAPPTAAGKPAAPAPTSLDKSPASKTTGSDKKAAASKAPTDQGSVVDMLAVENAKLDAKIKTICRGC
jgi:hypothetical protein